MPPSPRRSRRAADYVVEFRFQRSDGSWRWMEGRGRATYLDGRPTVLYGIGIDITERKQAEEAIRAREERLRLAAEAGGFGLYDYDLEQGGMYWSPELHQILGTDGDAAAPEDAAIHPDDREATLERFAAAQAPLSDGSFDHEYRMVRPDESVRWVSTHGQTYFSEPEPSPTRRAAPLDRGRRRRHGAEGRPRSSATCSSGCSATSSGRRSPRSTAAARSFAASTSTRRPGRRSSATSSARASGSSGSSRTSSSSPGPSATSS